MYGKKVKLRILFLSLLLLSIILTIFLILICLSHIIIYFKSPTENNLLKQLT